MPALPHHALLAPFGWEHRFEVLEKIGAGAMGQVWRAREIATDRIVALKMIDPARCGDEQILARLEIEGETLTKLRAAGSHDHVVPILDFKITDSHACLVMEFIPGLSLKKWCATHHLSLQDRVKFISQVARASGWFHALGIVHRDLKPANILVHAVTHQPVVVDFSIAKQDEGVTLTLTNEALGTAPYMAPEQFDKRRGPISPATDVFALGSTLYELLTQVHPHPGDFPQIMQRLVDEVRPAPPSALNPAVPKDLESIVLKALSHRPDDRYADGTELVDDLDRFLVGEPVKARPISTMAHLVRRARRKPALTAALAACLALALVAAWGVRRAGKERHQREVEARLTAAYRADHWSRASLQEVEAEIAALAVNEPALAARHTATLRADVAEDFENTLRRGDLKSTQLEWLRDAALPWLRRQNHPQAATLDQLLTERLGRWETRAQITAPFTDLQGLFTDTRMQVRGGLLHAPDVVIPDPTRKADNQKIRILEKAQSPIEVSMTFRGDDAMFKYLRITHLCQSLALEVYLYRHSLAPGYVRALFKEPESLNPDGYVLLVNRHLAEVQDPDNQVIFIPDTGLMTRGFTLTTRIEDRRLMADIDGRWSCRIEDFFAFASAESGNAVDIHWPSDLGMSQMTVRTRLAGTAGPMEQADVLYSQSAYRDAQRLYEGMLSDPALSAEAGYKLGRCLRNQEDLTAAKALWEKISQGPPSAWQQLSTYPLWLSAARAGGVAAASPYLARLPDPPFIAPQLTSSFISKDRGMIKTVYGKVGHGLNALRRDVTALNEAMKALGIMRIPPPEIAVDMALALHFGGLDEESRKLFTEGLALPRLYLKDSTCQAAAAFVLEHWTRANRSEKSAALRRALSEWCEVYPENPSYRAISQQEAARVLARAGKLPEALSAVRQAHENAQADPRILTAGWLLEGMIHQEMRQTTEALRAWKQAAQTSVEVESRSSLHLTDLILLHSAARTWTREICTQVIIEIVGRGKAGSAAAAARSLFISHFMIGDDFILSLNGISKNPQGRKFLEDAIFRRITAREVIVRIYQLILKSYFLSTAFTQPTAEQEARVHQLTGQLTEALATLPEGEASLQLYFQTWSTLPAEPDLAAIMKPDPRFAALTTELKWLLAQRYRHLGKPEAVQILEK